MARLWLSIAAANGFIAVAMGAFAAHGLNDGAQAKAGQWVETGADYQMAHALALLTVAWLSSRGSGASQRGLTLAGSGFVVGIVLFSGGLYVMALSGVTALGAIVPIGGLAFLAGWALLFYLGLRYGVPVMRAERAMHPNRDDESGDMNG